MINGLKITKEAVLKASKRCADAKAVLKDLFPDIFESSPMEIGNIYRYTNDKDKYYTITRDYKTYAMSFIGVEDGFIYSDSEESIKEKIRRGSLKYCCHLRDLIPEIKKRDE